MSELQRATRPPVIDAVLAETLEQFAGQWVAVEDSQVVASAPTAIAVLDQAREQGYADPLVFRVPKHPRLTAFYHQHEAVGRAMV